VFFILCLSQQSEISSARFEFESAGQTGCKNVVGSQTFQHFQTEKEKETDDGLKNFLFSRSQN
jgi:hypothetical protein